MRIARLDVDEGFLDGLSIEFDPGLNVLIGARGVGKTSVIEILRFALGAPWFTSDAQARSLEQIKSVLGSGLARVTLTDGEFEVVVMRSLRDDAPRSSGPVPSITVLAQNEIEAVGVQPLGRLGLVDRFRQVGDLEVEQRRMGLELRSLGSECRELLLGINLLAERIEEFRDVPEILVVARQQQQAALEGVAASEEDQQALERLQQRSSMLAAQDEVLSAARSAIASVNRELGSAADVTGELPSWPVAAGNEDLLVNARRLLSEARGHLALAAQSLAGAETEITASQSRLEARQIAVDAEARALRGKLEGLRVGLGQITKRVDELRERSAQGAALEQQAQELRSRFSEAAHRRRATYVDLERLRSQRFESRAEVAQWLTSELAPNIRVTVTRAASRQSYAAALAELLKGSGLHYNRLAPQMAAAISPLELVELVEARDVVRLADLVSIPEERSQSLISYLYTREISGVLAAPIDDSADLWLMDGADYKSATALSIGQRCTAVLPVLLRSQSDVLIVDQPEDHLDNAFISGTLVSTLRNRAVGAQFIFASHNANIPVLGLADRIIHLESDGKRGFVRHQGDLDDRASVQAVTDVMEGGAEAFRQRAAFYASHA